MWSHLGHVMTMELPQVMKLELVVGKGCGCRGEQGGLGPVEVPLASVGWNQLPYWEHAQHPVCTIGKTQ